MSFVNKTPRVAKQYDATRYTEVYYVAGGTIGWSNINVTALYGIPVGSVLEVFVDISAEDGGFLVGCRTEGSTLNRIIKVSGSEYTSGTTSLANGYRTFVTVGPSGIVQLYRGGSPQASLHILGYWTGVTFVEQFIPNSGYGSPANQWHSYSASPAYAVRNIVMTTTNSSGGVVGVKLANTPPNERSVYLSRANVGYNCSSFMTKCDENGSYMYKMPYTQFDVIYDMGYFTPDTMDYDQDLHSIGTPVPDAWTTFDINARLDRGNRTADMVVLRAGFSGFRSVGQVYDRRSWTKIAQGADFAIHTNMSVNTNASGQAQYFTASNIADDVIMLGYFKPL